MKDRVVLAYSGGLDTSVAIRWLQDELRVEVIALIVDVGQGGDFEAIRQRALGAGALDAIIADARAEMADDICRPAIAANSVYEGKAPLVSSLSRPVIAKHLVATARSHGAKTVAHGCSGKGNDQVRFEVSVRALAPDLEVMAPVRSWGMTRSECITYGEKHGIDLRHYEQKPYSSDENLWGRAMEALEIEDPWATTPEHIFTLTVPAEAAPREPRELVIGFERGVPVSLDGASMPLHELISAVGAITGSFGFGRVNLMENRRTGFKSREAYECPGALALIVAHRDLEDLTVERDLQHEKARLEPRWSELVYDGLWYSPLREALDAFMASSQRHVTGDVRLRCGPGHCYPVGRRGPETLYDYELATYDASDSFRHTDAEGFIRLWGLGVQTWAARQRG